MMIPGVTLWDFLIHILILLKFHSPRDYPCSINALLTYIQNTILSTINYGLHNLKIWRVVTQKIFLPPVA